MQWQHATEGCIAYTKLLLKKIVRRLICAGVRTSPRCPLIEVYTWRGGTVLMTPQEERVCVEVSLTCRHDPVRTPSH